MTPLTGTTLEGMRVDVHTLWLIVEVYITTGLKGYAGGQVSERPPRQPGAETARGRNVGYKVPVFGLRRD